MTKPIKNKFLTKFEKDSLWNRININFLKEGPIEEMRKWIQEKYPDARNHDPEYLKPRALMAAILRQCDEFIL